MGADANAPVRPALALQKADNLAAKMAVCYAHPVMLVCIALSAGHLPDPSYHAAALPAVAAAVLIAELYGGL